MQKFLFELTAKHGNVNKLKLANKPTKITNY